MKKLLLILVSLFLFTVFIQATQLIVENGETKTVPTDTGGVVNFENNDYGITGYGTVKIATNIVTVSSNSKAGIYTIQTLKITKADNFSTTPTLKVSSNSIGLQAEGGGSSLTIENINLKMEDNNTAIRVASNGFIDFKVNEIELNNNEKGIFLTAGNVSFNKININSGKYGIYVQADGNNLNFEKLTLNENQYGIYLNFNENYGEAELDLNDKDSIVDLNNNTIAGIYVGDSSKMTINSQIIGKGNNTLLEADNGGKIYLQNSISISSNTYGLYSKGSNSLIQVSSLTISNNNWEKAAGIKLEDSGQVVFENATLRNNYTGIEVFSGSSDISNATINMENNAYGFSIQKGANLDINYSTITLTGNSIAGINVSTAAVITISSSSITAINNENIIKVSGKDTTAAKLSLNNVALNSSNNKNGIFISDNGEVNVSSNFKMELSSETNAIFLEGGTFEVEAGATVDIVGNKEQNTTGFLLSSGTNFIKGKNNSSTALIISSNTYGIKTQKTVEQSNGNVSNFQTFKVMDNKYGLYIDGQNFNLNFSGKDSIFNILNNDVAVYAVNSGSITIKIDDMDNFAIGNNNILLKAEKESYINFDVSEQIEEDGSGEYGIYSAEGSTISIVGLGVTISNRADGIVVKDGGTIELANETNLSAKNNSNAGILINGQGSNISGGTVISQNNNYGLMVSSNVKFKMNLSETTFNVLGNKEADVYVTDNSTITITGNQRDSKLSLKSNNGFMEVESENFKFAGMNKAGAVSTGIKSLIKFDNKLELENMISGGISANNGGRIEIKELEANNNKTVLLAEEKGTIIITQEAEMYNNTTGIELKNGGQIEIASLYMEDVDQGINVVGMGNKISSTNITFRNFEAAIVTSTEIPSEVTISSSSIEMINNVNLGIHSKENGKVIIGEDVTITGTGILLKADKGTIEVSTEAKNFEIKNSSIAIQLANGGKLSIKDTLKLSNNTIGILIDNTTGNIDGVGMLNLSSDEEQTGIKLINGTLNITGTTITSLMANKAAIETEGNKSIIRIIDSQTEIASNFIEAKTATDIRLENSKVTGSLQDKNNNINVNIYSKSEWKLNGDAQVKTVTIAGDGKLNLGGKTASGSPINSVASNGINRAIENGGYNKLKVANLVNTSNQKGVLEFNVDLDNKQANILEVTNAIEGKYKLEIEYDTPGRIGTVVKLISTTVQTPTGRNRPFYYWEEKNGYDFDLYQGSELKYKNSSDIYSWYLVQSEQRTDAFKTINNTPEVLSLVFKSGMNSLNRRLGDIRRTPEDSYSGVWARGFGKNYDVTNQIKTTVDIFGVEGGYDFRVKKDSEDRYYIGLMIGYQSVGSIKTQQTNGGSDGHGDGTAPSFGAYGSWIGKNGYFVDLALRYFMIDLNMTSYSRQDDEIGYKPKANYIGFSGEFGKEFEFDVSDNKLRVEPKVELIFGTTGSQSMETTSGEKLEYGGTTVLNGKLKVGGSYQFELENEMLIEPIIELGYGTEMAGKTDITYGKGKYTSDFSGGYFEVSGGVNAYLTKGFSAYSLVTMESGDSQSNFGWNIGVRYGFGGSKQVVQNDDKITDKEKRNKIREKQREKEMKARMKEREKREKERNKNKKDIKDRASLNNKNKGQIKQKVVRIEEINTNEIEKVILRKDSIREVTIDGRIEEKELENNNKVEANELTQEQKRYIIHLAKGLAEEEIEAIGIAGHVVDISGDEAENKKNSIIKAKRVKQIFVKCGIEAEKIKVRGYGSKKPIASNKTKEGRAKNDRIEIFIKR